MKLTKWQKIKFISAAPFFLFVPASVYFINQFLLIVISFFIYFLLWISITSTIEFKKNNEHWVKNFIGSSIGIIALQITLTFIIGFILVSTYTGEKPKVKLKKLHVPEKPNQCVDSIVTTPVDLVKVRGTQSHA